MGTWEGSEQSKKYRNDFKKQNYDALSVNLPKGLKQLFVDELKIDDKKIAEFITNTIIKYLLSRGHTVDSIEKSLSEARKKAGI